MAAPNDLIHFHYPFSPFARRITWYLALRGIDHAECIQPATLPRPDLTAMNINYRRIPLLSIGRSVYCDTRLIVSKLESLFPSHPRLGASSTSDPTVAATTKLLEFWTVDGGIFTRASQTLPPELPLLQDPQFTKDREDFSGGRWDPQSIRALRPEALAHVRAAFDFLESGFLADGRQWILATEKPSLADIEAIWPFHWLVLGLKGALPTELISTETHPKVFAYVERFDAAVKDAMRVVGKPKRLKGNEAVDHITRASFPDAEETMVVDERDPLAGILKKGMVVGSWPVDTGFRHKDVGRLVNLDRQELVLDLEGKEGRSSVRIHHPRWNFRAKPMDGEGSKL